MSDNDAQPPLDDATPDYSKFNVDSVPLEEREIKETHPGRPDLDYDETPVGPAEEAKHHDDS
uniref:Multidrug transporter n=1 Tax=Heterorhabditis bacteriophora TaxID=37862 RepID=A0A1I7XRZ4_HETBA